MTTRPPAILGWILAATAVAVGAPDLEEFRVKREAVFEFATPPAITRAGDTVTITFETKGLCDVTIAIENTSGRIVRHLACGVLGANAPKPFRKNSRRQRIVWDGKDDRGRYIDDLAGHRIRVSLGLRARFERSLFFSPYKRLGTYPSCISATPEGVYVFDGQGADLLRLYDHDGTYVRTVYPFPADKLDKVVGLERQRVVQLGEDLPKKLGYTQATLLSSGGSSIVAGRYKGGNGYAASTMAVRDGRIALAHVRLNRLTGDGTTGGLPLAGPKVGYLWRFRDSYFDIGPTSSAFSPDGKWLYLTGYFWRYGAGGSGGHGRHGVSRLAYDKDAAPETFVGNMEMDRPGDGDGQFSLPTSVACDATGRVYVADYLNNRVQVFDAAGKFLKRIAVKLPAKVQIDPRNGEVYVFSWWIGGVPNRLFKKYGLDWREVREMGATLTRFSPFPKAQKLERSRFWLPPSGRGRYVMGQPYHVEIDFWAKTPTIWAVCRKGLVNPINVRTWGQKFRERAEADDWLDGGVLLLTRKNGEWRVTRNFHKMAAKRIVRVRPPDYAIQRLYVNPANHKLYYLELLTAMKSHYELLEIDPLSGKVKRVPLPFRAEDICFDNAGHVYLRTDTEVVRYNAKTWQEVPWDYGEQRKSVAFNGRPRAKTEGALPIPGARPMWFHQYGMWVSPRGHLAVSCVNRGADPSERTPGYWKGEIPLEASDAYTPTLFPGRARHQEIHIWDEHGQLIRRDATPGLGIFHGLGIDADDNIYVMSQGTRVLADPEATGRIPGGTPFPNPQAGTLIKLRSGGVKVLSSTRNQTKRYVPFAPVLLGEHPKRIPDTTGRGEGGHAWFTGAEWFYGGVGIVGAGCICWHTRFQMDSFARSFAPEPDTYSVAVLDTAGNLILRIGQYGNVDDGVPLIRDPADEVRSPRPLGGDELALFYPAYIGVDTDRRLFVADIANYRIAGVRLDYHQSARLPLAKATERRP